MTSVVWRSSGIRTFTNRLQYSRGVHLVLVCFVFDFFLYLCTVNGFVTHEWIHSVLFTKMAFLVPRPSRVIRKGFPCVIERRAGVPAPWRGPQETAGDDLPWGVGAGAQTSVARPSRVPWTQESVGQYIVVWRRSRPNASPLVTQVLRS